MSFRLRVRPVRSSGRLSGALSPGQAGECGDFDGGVLVVDEKETADNLVETKHNVEWADSKPGRQDERETMERATIQTDEGRLADKPYSELRSMAAEADTDEVDGRSSKDEILEHLG